MSNSIDQLVRVKGVVHVEFMIFVLLINLSHIFLTYISNNKFCKSMTITLIKLYHENKCILI